LPPSAIIPPEIWVLSPINQTFNESTVPLTFLVDKAVYRTGYILDGTDNVTFAGNATLTGLTDGLHNITVYAQDTFGNIGTSQTTNFTIALPIEVKPEPFPTTIVVVASVLSVLLVAGLLVYSKKHKQVRIL
jgi:hypothetical protein